MPFTAHKILLPDGQETLSNHDCLLAENDWMQATRRLLQMLYPYGPRGKSIADLGCHEGGYTLEFAKMGWQATGIEVRQTNIDNCQIVQRAFGLPNLHFIRDDVLNLAKYGPFDVIFCCGLLYHLENPGAYIELMGRQARDAVIIHTHFAAPEPCPRFTLSDMTQHEGLPGRWYQEHDSTDAAEMETHKWSSWANRRSFWPTRGAILQKLNTAGFDVVFEPADWMPRMPRPGILNSMTSGYYVQYARSMFVGVRTQRLGSGRPAAAHMTEAEWHGSDDAGAMLDFLFQQLRDAPAGTDVRLGGDVQESDAAAGAEDDLTRSLHRFYLASCRGIWKLLPQEASRQGVELAERFLAGAATAEEVNAHHWFTEKDAFRIHYNTAPEDVARWVAEVRALPAAELRAMLHPPETAAKVGPRELLKQAAYFADYAMIYPGLCPNGPPPTIYRPFLSAEVLRRHVVYPGRAAGE